MKSIDCKYFIGEKPCRMHKRCRGKSCPDYKGLGRRMLIIKLGAIGDVLRTTPILPELKKKYKDSHITWLADSQSSDVLRSNPLIDRLYVLNLETVLRLLVERFDLLISLDKAEAGISMATLVEARKKIGFSMDKNGNLGYFNDADKYAFTLGIDDELKFNRNRKTYQRIVSEMCGFGGDYGEYILSSSRDDKIYVDKLFKKWKVKAQSKIVGLNTGSGKVFITKKWPEGSFVKLAELLHKKLNAEVLLLGGPDEIETNRRIKLKSRVPVIHTGNNHTVKQFSEIVGLCDLLVASDTLAMHLAVAKKVPVVALFGSTAPHEVDLYGRGAKLFAKSKCAPCYRARCSDMKCMKAITPEIVFEECVKFLK